MRYTGIYAGKTPIHKKQKQKNKKQLTPNMDTTDEYINPPFRP